MSREARPDFMIIGAAKSATSTLHGALLSAPGIFMTTPKEPAFFSNPAQRSKGIEWYRSLFEPAAGTDVRGEASTTYSRFPFDTKPNTTSPWPEIAKLFPGIPLIYLVRHPVDRAFSHYRHWLRNGNRGSFEDAIEIEPPILDCSRYRSQIEHVTSVLGDVPIHVETFDRLHADQSGVVDAVRAFLGAGDADRCGETNLHLNEHNHEQVLSAWLHRNPLVRRLRPLVPGFARGAMKRMILATPVSRLVDRKVDPGVIRPETRSRLLDQFGRDVDFIEDLLGTELHQWRE